MKDKRQGFAALTLQPALNLAQDRLLELSDSGLIALIKGPLFDPLSTNRPYMTQDFQVFTRGGLGDSEFLRNEAAAYTILDQVPIHLGRKVTGGAFEPFQDLPPAAAGQCSQCKIRSI
jgi:hypothetical protein